MLLPLLVAHRPFSRQIEGYVDGVVECVIAMCYSAHI